MSNWFAQFMTKIMWLFGLQARRLVLRIPGLYSLANTYRWRTFMRAGDTVVQAGVDMGEKLQKGLVPNAIAMSRIVGPRGIVVAIEPSQESILRLEEYMQAHAITNIVPVNKALWDREEQLEFRQGRQTWHSRLAAVSAKTEQQSSFVGSVLVQADTLDHILDDLGISNVAHVCLTINGAEFEALTGMAAVLAQPSLSLLIAGGLTQQFKAEQDNVPVEHKITQLLQAHDFRVSRDKIGWITAKKP